MPFITLDNKKRLFVKAYSERTVRHAIKLYRAGHSPMMIASEVDAPLSTVENWIARSGYSRSWGEAARLRVMRQKGKNWKELQERAEYLYCERRLSAKKVSEMLDLGNSTVYMWMKRAGKLRTKSEIIRDVHNNPLYPRARARMQRIEAVGRMRKDGEKLREIASEVGVCVHTVLNYLEHERNPYRRQAA